MADSTDVILRLCDKQWSSAVSAGDRTASVTNVLLISAVLLQGFIVLRGFDAPALAAAALMIGLAVVSMTLTVGESVKAQFRSTLESSVRADYLAVDESGADFPAEVATRFDELPETADVTSFRYDRADIDGVVQSYMATDLAATEVLFDLDLTEGVVVDPDVDDAMLVAAGEAETQGIEVGDVVPMTFQSGPTRWTQYRSDGAA